MKMRQIGDAWYSNFNWKGEKVQLLLEHDGQKVTGGSKDNPPNAAYMAIGAMMKDLENGIAPGAIRKKLGKIEFPKKLEQRSQQILDGHIVPFFGDCRRRDIDAALIKKYMAHRWGLTEGGGLQATHNTWKKERNVLQRLVRLVDPAFAVPKVDYKKLFRALLPPLTMADIKKTEPFVLEKYRPVFWTMAYTALDISDVTALTREHIQDGRIIKKRGKTEQDIRIPICPALGEVFKALPRQIREDVSLFSHLFDIKEPEKAISKDVRAAFKRAGYGVANKKTGEFHGYGSKYLRRYLASFFLDKGYTSDWIAQVLAHAEGSNETQKYTKVYDATADKAFSQLG